jgi:hypothetical protein
MFSLTTSEVITTTLTIEEAHKEIFLIAVETYNKETGKWLTHRRLVNEDGMVRYAVTIKADCLFDFSRRVERLIMQAQGLRSSVTHLVVPAAEFEAFQAAVEAYNKQQGETRASAINFTFRESNPSPIPGAPSHFEVEIDAEAAILYYLARHLAELSSETLRVQRATQEADQARRDLEARGYLPDSLPVTPVQHPQNQS